MAWKVICGNVLVRAFANKADAENLAASWRRSGANARVVWGAL